MANSKNKKVPKKRSASDKSTCRTSSDQKENVPKNQKTRRIKPGPNEGIAMSKQLLSKKNNVRTQRRSSSKPERIGANGKPLPSLADLEKMYEDSDDDQPPKTPTQKPTCTATSEEQLPKSISEKNLLSPSVINKITERIMGSIQKQDLPDPSELMEATSLLRAKTPPPPPIVPPKKRKKPDVPYIVGCKDRPKVMSKPTTNFCKGYDDYGVEASSEDSEEDTPAKRAKRSRIPNYSKSIFNAHSDEIAERLAKDDAGGLSDASTDSNKTIEYNPTVFRNSRPHSFSPLPSTSRDTGTFSKNDELFNESLKQINISTESTSKVTEDDLPMIELSPSTKKEDDFPINIEPTPKNNDDQQITNLLTPKKKDDFLINNLLTPNKRDDILITKQSTPEEKEDDVQIIDNAYDTIVIEDVVDRTVGKQHTSNTIDTDIIEIIEPEELEVVKPKEETIIHKIPDDEECMVVPSSETIKNHNNFNLNEPIVIDDEYSTINTEFNSFNNEPNQIIDVDDVIAENRSILDKWKNFGAKELQKINTVVDVPTTYKNVTVAPQATFTPSTTAQTTVTPSTTAQTTVTPSTAAQTTVTPNATAQKTVTPSTTAQTTVRPSTAAQTTVTPSTTAQTTVRPSTAAQTTVRPSTAAQTTVTPSTTAQTTVTPSTTAQTTVRPSTVAQTTVTPSTAAQTTVTPSTTVQTPSTPGSILQASVITASTISSRSTSNPDYDLNVTNRTRPTISQNNQRQSARTITYRAILRDFFNSSHEGQGDSMTIQSRIAEIITNFCSKIPGPNSIYNRTHSHSTNKPVRHSTRDGKTYYVVDYSHSPTDTETQQQVPSRNIGDCPICLDPLHSSNGIASTICGHVFCLKCIQASVKTNGKKCPTCRKPLKGGGYHQLYL